MAVIVGDLATDNDARRLWAAGLAAVPITTGQACHLEAGMVARGLQQLEQELGAGGGQLADLELLVIENVGNLVCPAAYDLGESLRVVMLSVTEGEDKPLRIRRQFPWRRSGADQQDRPARGGGVRPGSVPPPGFPGGARARTLAVSARTGAGFSALRPALGLAGAAPALRQP
jgi:hydrogenase nickel incorporation protein HypB